jgi:hypothetical protein
MADGKGQMPNFKWCEEERDGIPKVGEDGDEGVGVVFGDDDIRVDVR